MRRLPGRTFTALNLAHNLTDFSSANAGFDLFDDEQDYEKRNITITDASDYIVDVREYDVPYHVRVSIDKGGIEHMECPE